MIPASGSYSPCWSSCCSCDFFVMLFVGASAMSWERPGAPGPVSAGTFSSAELGLSFWQAEAKREPAHGAFLFLSYMYPCL